MGKYKIQISEADIKKLEKINPESEENIKAEKIKYEKSYKNILWIDDKNNSLTWMKQYLKNDSDIFAIRQANKFIDAVKEIKNSYKYDLVIINIDLEHAFTDFKGNNDAESKKYLEEEFEKYHIEFNYDEVSVKPGRKSAGVYLYLMLAAVGYPLNRMLIYTEDGIEPLKTRFADVDFEKISKIKRDGNLDIDEYFNEDNSYYRIRRLVFQACEKYKNELNECKSSRDIPFNKLYFKDKDDKAVEIDSFADMLERVEMLFPVVRPVNPECVYYQALKVVSMYHDENTDLKKIDRGSIRKFHAAVKNFRSWSAHNKFRRDENNRVAVSADEFALLFCIALRTYFDRQKHKDPSYYSPKYHLSEDLHEYEEAYFSNAGEIKLDSRKLSDKADKVIQKINLLNSDMKALDKLYMDKIIQHLGKQPQKERTVSEIILGLFDIIHDESDKTGRGACGSINANGDVKAVSFSYELKYSIKEMPQPEVDSEKKLLLYAFRYLTEN